MKHDSNDSLAERIGQHLVSRAMARSTNGSWSTSFCEVQASFPEWVPTTEGVEAVRDAIAQHEAVVELSDPLPDAFDFTLYLNFLENYEAEWEEDKEDDICRA